MQCSTSNVQINCTWEKLLILTSTSPIPPLPNDIYTDTSDCHDIEYHTKGLYRSMTVDGEITNQYIIKTIVVKEKAIAQLQADLEELQEAGSATQTQLTATQTELEGLQEVVAVVQETGGPSGDKGDKGDKGNKGDTGATGATGANGATGAQGANGATGAQGAQGSGSSVPQINVWAGAGSKSVMHNTWSNYAHASYSTTFGRFTEVHNCFELAMGANNKRIFTGHTVTAEAIRNSDALVIGNGISPPENQTADATRENAFRVRYDGYVYAKRFNTSGADYCEYFEWADGNPAGEDRIGLFVTLEGAKIKIAQPTDDIIGLVSGNGSVIGNAQEDSWGGQWLHDVYGREIYQTCEDEQGLKVEKPVSNPLFDSDAIYVPRSKRPEWDTVGMVGQMIVNDDGTSLVGKKCKCGVDGIATAGSKYRVIARLDETTIKILANFL